MSNLKIDSLLKCLCDIEDGVSGCRRDERLCRRYHTPEIIKYFKTLKKIDWQLKSTNNDILLEENVRFYKRLRFLFNIFVPKDNLI